MGGLVSPHMVGPIAYRLRIDEGRCLGCLMEGTNWIRAPSFRLLPVHESQRPQPVAFLEHDRDKSSILLVVNDIASAVKHIDTSLGKTIPVRESIAKSLKASEG